MIVSTYPNAADFLEKTQSVLEEDEAANNLMLGICLRLRDAPMQVRSAPYFVSVEDANGLVAAAIMTPPHKLLVFGACRDLGETLGLIMQDLWLRQCDVPGVLGPSGIAGAFADAWVGVSRGEAERVMRQRVYKLTRVARAHTVRGSLRPANEGDKEFVARWMCSFHDEIFSAGDLDQAREDARARIEEQNIFIWEDGKPVSMAAKARPTSHGITVNLVFTPPAYRRRGYATACVAGLSQQLLDQGWRFCTLFADLSNLAVCRRGSCRGLPPTTLHKISQ